MSEHRKEDASNFPPIARLFLWVDDKKKVDRFVHGLYGACALLFGADFLYHKHTYVSVENIPGFYALYGFIMCALLVIAAKGLRLVLKRPEDYYAPKDVESEDYPEDQLERLNHGD